MWKADAAKTSLWHPPDLCGTLEKQSKKRGDWKPRFFALKGSNLFWFTSPTARSPKGHIPLEGAAVHSVRPPAISEYTQEHVLDNRKGGPPALFGIVILTDESYAGSPGGRPELVVAASSPELQALWTKALQQASIPRPQLLAKLHEQSRLVDILGGYENMPTEAEGLAGGEGNDSHNQGDFDAQHHAGFGNHNDPGYDPSSYPHNMMMATDGSLASHGLPGPAYPGTPTAAGYGEGEGGEDGHPLIVAPRALSDSGAAGLGFMGGMGGMNDPNTFGGASGAHGGVPRSSFAFAQHPSQGGGWGKHGGPGGDGGNAPPFSSGNDGRFNDTAREGQYSHGMGQQQYNNMIAQQYSQGGVPGGVSLTRRSYDGSVMSYATRSGHMNPNFNNSSNGGSARHGTGGGGGNDDASGRKSPLRQRAEQLINGLRKIVSGRGGKGEEGEGSPRSPRGGPQYATAADYYHQQLGAHHTGDAMHGSQYGDGPGGPGFQYGGPHMGEGEWHSAGGAAPGAYHDPQAMGPPTAARRTVDLRSAAVSEAWAGGLIPQHRGSDNGGGGRVTPPRRAADVTVGGTLVHGIVGNWANSGAVPLGSRAGGGGGNGMASPRSGGGSGAMTPRGGGGAAGSGLRTPSGRTGTRSPAAGSDLNMFAGQQRPASTGQAPPNLASLRVPSGLGGGGRAGGLNPNGSFNGTSTPRTTVEDVASEAASVTDRLSLASHVLQHGGSQGGSPKAPHPSFAPASMMGAGAGGIPGPAALDALAAVQAQVAHASQLLQVHAERLERSLSSGSNEGAPPTNPYGAQSSNRGGMDPASPRLGQDIATSMGGMPAPHMGRTRRANTDWFISQFDELRQSLAAMQAMMAKGGRGGPGSHSPGSPAGPPPAMQAAPGSAESEVSQRQRSRLSGYLAAVRQQLLTLQAHRASLAELESEEAAGLEAALLSVHNALAALGGERTGSTSSTNSYGGPPPAAAAYPQLRGSGGPGGKQMKGATNTGMHSSGWGHQEEEQSETRQAGYSPRERDVSMMSMLSNGSAADSAPPGSRHMSVPPAMQASNSKGPARPGSTNNGNGNGNGMSRMGQANTRNPATSHADMAVTVGADGASFNVTTMGQRSGSVQAIQGRGPAVHMQAQGPMRQVAGSGSTVSGWGMQPGGPAGGQLHMSNNSPHHLGNAPLAGQSQQLQLPGAPGGKGSRAGSIREAAQELRQHYMGIAASGTTTSNGTAATFQGGYGGSDMQHPASGSAHQRLMSNGTGSRTGSQASDSSSVSGMPPAAAQHGMRQGMMAKSNMHGAGAAAHSYGAEQYQQHQQQYSEQGRAGLGSLSTPLPDMPSSSSFNSSAYESELAGVGASMSRSPGNAAPAGGPAGSKAWGPGAVRASDRRARYSSTDHC